LDAVRNRWEPEITSPLARNTSNGANDAFDLLKSQQQSYIFEVPDPDRTLKLYRERFAPHFPFIIIPDDISPQDLRVQKPWLYRTIMMVGSPEDLPRQVDMGNQIVSQVSTGMLIRGEKSLDMLQVFIYFWRHSFPLQRSQEQVCS